MENSFGILIGDLRREYGISRETLASGLCSPAMLRKYEAGEVELEKLLADALFQRLGKSMDKFEVVLNLKEYGLAVERAQIQEMFLKGETDKAEAAIRKYEGKLGEGDVLHWQFAALQKAELYRRKGERIPVQSKNVLEGLLLTVPKMKVVEGRLVLDIGKCRFGFLELCLLSRYGVLLEEIGELGVAILHYQNIIGYLEQEVKRPTECDKAGKYRNYPFVAYRLAGCYASLKRYQEALGLIEAGCAMLKEHRIQAVLFIRMMELKHNILRELGQKIEKWEAASLALLELALGEDRAVWIENYYPVYVEMNLHSANDTIRERRKLFGWSEEEVAEKAYCHKKTIARLEAGKNMPQKALQDAIFAAFGLSTEKYDGGIVTGRYSDYRKYAKMGEAFYNEEYKEAERYLEELKNGMDMEYVSNSQFVRYWETQLRCAKEEISREEKEEQLWEMFQQAMPEQNEHVEKETQKNKISTAKLRGGGTMFECERNIIKWVSWYAEGEKLEETYHLFLMQYGKFQEESAKKYFFSFHYMVVLYLLTRACRKQKRFKEAEDFIKLALSEIGLMNLQDFWDRLLLARFMLEKDKCEEKGRKAGKEELLWFRMSYAVCRLFEGNDRSGMSFIENYLDKYYGSKEEVLGELLE